MRWRGHPLITAAVAPHATYTVSAEHLREAHALAAKHDVPMLMHLAEARSEVELIREQHGKGPVEYVAALGILDDRVVAAHMIFPTPCGDRAAGRARGRRGALPAVQHEGRGGRGPGAGAARGRSRGRPRHRRLGLQQRPVAVGGDGHRGQAPQGDERRSRRC